MFTSQRSSPYGSTKVSPQPRAGLTISHDCSKYLHIPTHLVVSKQQNLSSTTCHRPIESRNILNSTTYISIHSSIVSFHIHYTLPSMAKSVGIPLGSQASITKAPLFLYTSNPSKAQSVNFERKFIHNVSSVNPYTLASLHCRRLPPLPALPHQV